MGLRLGIRSRSNRRQDIPSSAAQTEVWDFEILGKWYEAAEIEQENGWSGKKVFIYFRQVTAVE